MASAKKRTMLWKIKNSKVHIRVLLARVVVVRNQLLAGIVVVLIVGFGKMTHDGGV
ncbi:hypothetical protein J1N35_008530 [Gossypium stocksii]|uniref:Uncharacterized protein n=1 Tax=Gossypium stocksii TaxID=47602 RepID=A0A9D4AEL1_9ROSI|nr:hypothetical protein J1N35_008530 [Gossypium stocksii]